MCSGMPKLKKMKQRVKKGGREKNFAGQSCIYNYVQIP